MSDISIERKCNSCGQTIQQTVSYKETDGRIEVTIYLANCPICKGFLKVPTPGEIRRAYITNEKQQ